MLFLLVTLHLSLMSVMFEIHGLAKVGVRSVNGNVMDSEAKMKSPPWKAHLVCHQLRVSKMDEGMKKV